jgi:PAS domain S-box-containing protein
MPKVADFIETHRELLTRRFREEAGKLDSARGLKPHELINTLPEYLATLAAISRQGHRGDPAATKKRLEDTHIGLRLRHGYTQEEATSEYVLIGRLISSLWEALPPAEQPSAEDTGLLFAELQDAMEQVVATFSGYTLEDRQAEKRTVRRLQALAPGSLLREAPPASLQQQLAPLVRVIQEALGAEGAELWLVDAQGARLELAAATGACPPAPPEGLATPLGAASFVARVADAEEPVALPDALTTPLELREEVRHGGLRSLLGLRLWPHGKLMGVLWVGVRQTRPFEPRARRFLEMLVEVLSGLLDHALLVGELRQQQQQLTAVLEQMPAAVFIAEAPSGKLVFGNRQVAEVLGHPFQASSDVREYAEYQGYHPDGRRLAPEEYPMARALLRGEHVVREEVHYQRGDGSWAFLHVSASPVRDLEGRIRSAVVTVADLTETKRLAQEREEALALLDLLLASSPVGQAFVDRELRYVRINPALAAINGVSVEQTLGRTIHEVVPELAPMLEPLYRRMFETGEPPRDLEVTGRTPGLHGEQQQWQVSFFPVKDASGRPFMVGTVVQDITERKRAKEVLAQVDALVAAAPAGVALLDTHLRYVRINETLAAINGLPVEAHLGRTPQEALGAHSLGVEALLRQVMATGEALRGVEFTAIPANDPGVLHHWVGDYFPVRRPGGEVLGVGGLVVDITERKQHEEQLRRTAEFRERFLGIVSHDLRNPLNAIHLSASLLLREELPARATQSAQRIARSAERMRRMIGELLDFARGRLGGGIPITRRPGDLRPICRGALEELELAYPTRCVELRAEGHFEGEWDADRLSQLIGNLVKNALDYSPPHTPVRVELHEEGERVRMEVSNQGEPIAPEVQANLFSPFRRAAQDEEGTPLSGLGLGLFIVQQIALAHGGDVQVRSTREEGTTFTVRLPRHPADAGTERPGGPGGPMRP